MYPITKLILDRIKELQINKSELVKRVGYTNTTKGLRRLEHLLQRGWDSGCVLPNLPQALQLPLEQVREALIATESLLDAEKEAACRAAYFPHLWVETEHSVPSKIVFCGILGIHRLKKIALPRDFDALTPEGQQSVIRGLIRESMERDNGSILFFGRIKWYVLSRSYDEPQASRTVYDIRGNPIPDADNAMRTIGRNVMRITINRGKTDITNLFSGAQHGG